MKLNIDEVLVDLSNKDKNCHETVFDYCKDWYIKNCNIKLHAADNEEIKRLLWGNVPDANILTLANTRDVLYSGYIIGFFDSQTMMCQHSMIALDFDIWVGTNNMFTFLADPEAVVFTDILNYIGKGNRRVYFCNGQQMNIPCGAFWSKNGQFWHKDVDDCNYILKYRNVKDIMNIL